MAELIENPIRNLPNEPETINVVVVNHELPEDTIACIRSIMESEVEPNQVILVDNGSQDYSIEKISQALPDTKIFSLPENVGFAAGYNYGIDQALKSRPSHILLINNDAVVERTTLTHLLQSDWDIAVPKILFYSHPEKIWAAGARWRSFPPGVVVTGYRDLDGPLYNQPKSLSYATACALLVKMRVFETIGGFDEEFENYFEDYDLFFRANTAGLRSGYVPSARVLHKGSLTGDRNLSIQYRYKGRNTVLFFRKGGRFPNSQMWSCILWTIVREVVKGNTRLLSHYWRGVLQGLERSKRSWR